MVTKKIKLKLDVPGTIAQINSMQTEDQLFSLSRKLRMYFDLGLILIPMDIREAMNDKLDKIYRSL